MRTCTGCRPRVTAPCSSTTSSQPKVRAWAYPNLKSKPKPTPTPNPKPNPTLIPNLTLTLPLTLTLTKGACSVLLTQLEDMRLAIGQLPSRLAGTLAALQP